MPSGGTPAYWPPLWPALSGLFGWGRAPELAGYESLMESLPSELRKQRSAGNPGYHQLLGYSGSDGDVQGTDEEALIAFDSDDRAGMSWGDVQRVWTLILRKRLRAGKFGPVRATL